MAPTGYTTYIMSVPRSQCGLPHIQRVERYIKYKEFSYLKRQTFTIFPQALLPKHSGKFLCWHHIRTEASVYFPCKTFQQFASSETCTIYEKPSAAACVGKEAATFLSAVKSTSLFYVMFYVMKICICIVLYLCCICICVSRSLVR